MATPTPTVRRTLLAVLGTVAAVAAVWGAAGRRPVEPAAVVTPDRVTAGPFPGAPPVRVVCIDPCGGETVLNVRAASAAAVGLRLTAAGGRPVVVADLPTGALSVPVRPGARFAEVYLGGDGGGARSVLVVLGGAD